MNPNVLHPSSYIALDSSRTQRRAELFRETPFETLERWALGTAWAVKPDRIGELPALTRLCLSALVAPQRALPDPNRTLTPRGLCGLVHDLSAPTLTDAYKRGLFTFAHLGPLKWLSPAERCVLFVDEFHLGKTTRRLVKLGRHTVTFDRDFEGVIKACAGRRPGKWHLTWITPQIMRAYAELFDAGYAHSFEVWDSEGELAGGGYGLAIGGVFFTESLFSRQRDASKIGFAVLNWHLDRWGFILNDGKWMNPVLGSMGYRMISRPAFQAELARALAMPEQQGSWTIEADMKTVSEWQPRTAQRAAEASAPQKSKAARSTWLLPGVEAMDGEIAGLSHALAILL